MLTPWLSVLVGTVALLTGALLTGCGHAAVALVPSPTPTTSAPARSPSATDSLSPSPSRTWNLVALGDSVTSGWACGCTAFPDLYAAGLRSRYSASVTATNDGVNGQTSGQLLADLQDSTSDTARAVAGADVVVVTIGANDFADQHDPITASTCGTQDELACVRDELTTLSDNLSRLVARVRTLRHGARTALLLTGYWNVFEDGVVASVHPTLGRASTDALTTSVNDAIEDAAIASGATYVDLFRSFRGADGSDDPTSLLADDGDHPNAAGHEVIAEALLAAGLKPLT